MKKPPRTPEHCRNLSASIKLAWTEGRLSPHPKSVAAAKQNAASFWSDEGRRKNIEGRKSVEFQTAHKKRAKRWHLRSPENREFHFTNLKDFVRGNHDLFLPETLIERKGGQCAAYNGLSRLRADGSGGIATWRGWTWVSAREVFSNAGSDLLDREIAKSDQ